MTRSTDDNAPSDLPEPLRDRRQLGADDEFCFGCHSALECFKKCCSDINIMLTPVDVLKLSRRLDISTTDFLEKYTLTPITKDLHLPVVALKMGDDHEKNCQLLGEDGCTVYEDRPWSCRMYPVGMAIPPARAGVEPEPVYYLFEDEYCLGGTEKKKWTVKQWRADQGVAERETLEEDFQNIVSHPWFIGGRQLDPKRMQMFHMAVYDLDSFKRFVFESTFLDRFILEDDFVESIRTNDEALLHFAFRWLRFALFAEPTLETHDAAGPGKTS